MLIVLHDGTDAGDELDCLPRGCRNAFEHEQHPLFPDLFGANLLKQPIVVAFVLDNVPAQIEHRQVEQAVCHEIQDVNDAASAPVTIVERMDALKLVMDDRHLDERIHIKASRVIDKYFEIAHQFGDLLRMLGWRIDHFACSFVL